MPQPTASQVHVNSALTDVAVAYVQDQNNFIADKVFPNIPVQKASDVYYVYSLADFLRDEARERAPGTTAAETGYGLTTDTYSARVRALKFRVPDQIRENADPAADPEVAGTKMLMQKMLINRDRLFASSFFTTGVWTTDTTPATKWDAANGSPRTLVDAGKTKILTDTGFEPNTLVLGYEVFTKLRGVAEVRDQFKYTSAESIDEEMLARFFSVDKVIVGRSVRNSAVEGASHSGSVIFGDAALLCYVPDAPGVMVPSAGYTFSWDKYLGGNSVSMIQYRSDDTRSDVFEAEMAYDLKRVAAALGYFMNDVMT